MPGQVHPAGPHRIIQGLRRDDDPIDHRLAVIPSERLVGGVQQDGLDDPAVDRVAAAESVVADVGQERRAPGDDRAR